MNDILKKPYELSLWKDKQMYVIKINNEVQESETIPSGSTVLNDFIKESKVATIGSNDMDTPIRAFNPKFTTNVNGSHTLTFQVYYKYYNDLGQLDDNPWINYLCNEQKVKLHYDNEWYDFVIKKIDENSDNYTFTYTCTDLFIEELSKNGYNIEFDTDLENNQGSADYLASEVLKETEWRVASKTGTTMTDGTIIKSDLIKQYTNEALLVYSVDNQITAQVMEDWTDGTISYTTGQNVIIPVLSTIYICYSSIADAEEKYQFFWRADKHYQLDEKGTIVNSAHFEAVISNATLDNCAVSTDYRGNKLVRKQLSKYIDVLDKFCLEYTHNTNHNLYYGYKDNEYTSGANLQQLITNNTQFITSDEWAPYSTGNSIIDITTDGQLKITFKDNYGVYNNGLYSNRAWFSKGFISGDKLILGVKANSTIGLNFSIIGENVSAGSGYNNFTINATSFTPSNPQSGYIYYQFALPSISYNNLIDYGSLSVIIKGNVNSSYTFTDIQLFKYQLDSANNLIYPDLKGTLENQVVKTVYYLISESNLANITDKNNVKYDYVFYSESALLAQFTALTNNEFEKIRDISEEKSNRFNILQSICETFECWIKFIINHNNNGYTTYDYVAIDTTGLTPVEGKRYYTKRAEITDAHVKDFYYTECYNLTAFVAGTTYYVKVYDKYVQILNYISKNNYAGFRRGINLKSTQRRLDSNNIVTKLIVEQNNNSHASDGFCSIQLSNMNYYGESCLYNFDYYINQGLLNKDGLYRDLYNKSNTGGLGYLTNLRQLNKDNQGYITKEAQLGLTLTRAKAKEQAYKSLYEEAQTKQAEVEKYLTDNNYSKDITASSSYPDQINTWCYQRDTYKSRVTSYKAKYDEYKEMVSSYETQYKAVLQQLQTVADKKVAYNTEFNSKYSRYLREGSWIDESYMDADLYYLDGLGVLYNSAFPKVEYTISVLELSQLEGYEAYTFRIGDKSYIEDTEFFGWKDSEKLTPYQEEVIVSEVTYSLDDPSTNVLKIQNFKDQFESLFQRITATTQSLQYAEGGYARAASAISTDGTIDSALMDKALNENSSVISNATDQSVVWDNTGITISSILSKNKIVRLVNGGIVLTGDGGKNWTTGITADGINATAIKTGKLDTNLIRIYSGENASFIWDSNDLTAYGHDGAIVSDSKYVRFNQDGIIGYNNNKKTFGLTYDGLELSSSGTFSIVSNTSIFDPDATYYEKDGSTYKISSDTSFQSGKTYYTKNTAASNSYINISTNAATRNVTYFKSEGEILRPIIWAGKDNTDNFVLYDDGSIYAKNGYFEGSIKATSGEFTGTLKATTLDGQLTSTANGALVGTSIYVGGSGALNTTNYNFVVDSSGNVNMKGSISLNGKITFGGTTYDSMTQAIEKVSPPTDVGAYLRDNNNIVGTEIDTVTIKSPTIMGGVFYALDKNSKTYGEFKANGLNITRYDSNNSIPLIGIGYYTDSDSGSNWNYPYITLGQGIDGSGTNRGMIKKFSYGLWLGDSDDINSSGNGLGLKGTGLFVDFNSDKIYKVLGGSYSEIGAAVLG